MTYGTKEFYELQKEFEKSLRYHIPFHGGRVDKETDPESISRGYFYLHGEVNMMFHAYMCGYSHGRVNYMNGNASR